MEFSCDYPLKWPKGIPRVKRRERGRFTSINIPAQAQNIRNELGRFGGVSKARLVTNNPIRRDGYPYSDESREAAADPGVAIYFVRYGREHVIPCDGFTSIGANIRALALAIEGLRALDRYGIPGLLDRAMVGMTAELPMRGVRSWRDVLEVKGSASLAAVEQSYRNKAKVLHPDAGGDPAKWLELQAAYEQAKAEWSE